jgi:hypothetical protein
LYARLGRGRSFLFSKEDDLSEVEIGTVEVNLQCFDQDDVVSNVVSDLYHRNQDVLSEV